MKKLLFVAILGLVSSAIYAKGGFTGLKKLWKPEIKSHSGKTGTGSAGNGSDTVHSRSSLSESYEYVNAGHDYF